jgi:hypothetical protein
LSREAVGLHRTEQRPEIGHQGSAALDRDVAMADTIDNRPRHRPCVFFRHGMPLVGATEDVVRKGCGRLVPSCARAGDRSGECDAEENCHRGDGGCGP